MPPSLARGNGAAPLWSGPMPDTYSQRASALRQRARQEHDRGRAWYLRGLARRQIAEQLGCSKQLISKILLRGCD